MDLRQMEVVVAVAEEGGFTAAAQRLHVVQSAVSSTVRALERELGTALFDRTTHRVSLTPAGEAFVPAARATLRSAEQARSAVDVAQGRLRGRVTVGTMQGVWADLHLPLAALRAEHPEVSVRLRQAAVTDIRQALREGTVDLAVVALDRQQQRGLVTRLLSREEMVLVSAPERPLAGSGAGGTVTLAEAARLPMVEFTPAGRSGSPSTGRSAPPPSSASRPSRSTTSWRRPSWSVTTWGSVSCPVRSLPASPTCGRTGSTGTRRAGR